MCSIYLTELKYVKVKSVEISNSWNKPAIGVQDFTAQIIVLDQPGRIALLARLVPIKIY